MNDEMKELLSRLVTAGIGAIAFLIWGIDRYRNAEKVDKWMMDDWTRKFVEHTPIERRLRRFRRHMIPGLVGIIVLWAFFIWRLAQFLQALQP